MHFSAVLVIKISETIEKNLKNDIKTLKLLYNRNRKLPPIYQKFTAFAVVSFQILLVTECQFIVFIWDGITPKNN